MLSIVLFVLAGLSLASAIIVWKISCKKENLKAGELHNLASNEKQIIAFIEKYENVSSSFEVHLQNIAFNLREYEELLRQETQNKGRINDITAQIDKLNALLNEFFAKFELEKSLSEQQKLNRLAEAIKIVPTLHKELEQATIKLNELKSNSPNEAQIDNIKNIDIDNLQQEEKDKQAKLDELKAKKTQNQTQIEKLNEQWDNKQEIEENLATLYNTKHYLEKELKTIKLAKEFLNSASDELSSKYLSPLKTRLDNYINLILKNNSIKLSLDTNLNVSVDKGQTYDLEYLSKGYQSVVDLCIRFALVDVLFEGEKPFIVLDDPFVNMDAPKIRNALDILNEVAKEKQIIYLTCHKSRM